ncbi:MAG: hypothetical protein M0Z25_00710 [Nitrospiraceae bacterium]|nr:hypothetical protein [Nitrospiraceae bacterium]
MKNEILNEYPDDQDNLLADAFLKVEESIKSFHALLDTINREDPSSSLSEEDRKSRLVASQALRDSATIYLDWGWHYLSRLYEVPNPHNPEEDLLA